MAETPASKPRRTPIQGSGYTPLEMLGVVRPEAIAVETNRCERCGRDVNGTSHRAMCGYPLQPITDDEIAGIRETYERGEVAALGYSEVARLLNEIDRLRAQQGTPRVQYGVAFPDADGVLAAPDETTARGWATEYAKLDRETPRPARVQRRTITRSATDWEDVDEAVST